MKPVVRVFKDYDALSTGAAEAFVTTAAQSVQVRSRFLVALSGGGTPSGAYKLLATQPYRHQVDWRKTFVFWGDERCVPPDDEGSNYHQAMDKLLSRVSIPDENIQRIQGELGPVEASKRYIHTLKSFATQPLDWPRFDLVFLGMGEDGHTASLFPGSPVDLSDPAVSVSADYQGRPAERVTLTSPVFNSARQILFLATGKNKAGVLRQVLSGKYQPEILPAQRIRPADGTITWLIDEAAAPK